jgi:Co/Zn/Cd efflux system component
MPGYPDPVHTTLGQRDPATAFPLTHGRDDAAERRQADRAVAVSAVGLALTGGRINSATLVADARHSWLDALSSAGALAGLIAVALGQPWGDPVAGLAVTAFICHVGYEVTKDVVHRLADGIDPEIITRAEAAAGSLTWTARAAPS